MSRAQIVIIGGGIAGASIAYHLSELGVRDVIVLEQSKLVSGTTSHAPGLVGLIGKPAIQLLAASGNVCANAEGHRHATCLLINSTVLSRPGNVRPWLGRYLLRVSRRNEDPYECAHADGGAGLGPS